MTYSRQIPSKPVRIIDATLREGAQAPGVQFSAEDAHHIASAISALGVDMIECGHPAAGRGERDRVKAARAATDLPILAHARARAEDIKAAADAGADWVGVFIGVNDLSRRVRLSQRVADDVSGHITGAITLAKDLGLSVRFTVEDASRTSHSNLEDAFGAAIEAGADRICWADTVGVSNPGSVNAVVQALKAAFPETPLELHLHDDRGLALANALSGVEAGADWIAATVNGIGERCGIVDTLQLLVNLQIEGRAGAVPQGAAIANARDIVAQATGLQVGPQRAITGAHAFTHTSHLHRKAAERDSAAYEAINPLWSRPDASDNG